MPYIDAILGRKPIGRTVAIMGAGGIGFDVATLITHAGPSAAVDIPTFCREWGVDFVNHPRGGVTGLVPQIEQAGRIGAQRAIAGRRGHPGHAGMAAAGSKGGKGSKGSGKSGKGEGKSMYSGLFKKKS